MEEPIRERKRAMGASQLMWVGGGNLLLLDFQSEVQVCMCK